MKDELTYDIPKIEKARMAAGWSFTELCRRADCSPSIRDRPSAQWREATVAKLAKALGLNLADLVIRTDND